MGRTSRSSEAVLRQPRRLHLPRPTNDMAAPGVAGRGLSTLSGGPPVRQARDVTTFVRPEPLDRTYPATAPGPAGSPPSTFPPARRPGGLIASMLDDQDHGTLVLTGCVDDGGRVGEHLDSLIDAGVRDISVRAHQLTRGPVALLGLLGRAQGRLRPREGMVRVFGLRTGVV